VTAKEVLDEQSKITVDIDGGGLHLYCVTKGECWKFVAETDFQAYEKALKYIMDNGISSDAEIKYEYERGKKCTSIKRL